MPKSKATQAAIGWLQADLVPTDRSGEVVTCHILLADDLPLEARLEALGGLVELGRDLEMALLVLAQRADGLDLLVHLRDHACHKATAKQAKKFLFRAKQRGADIPEQAQPARSAVRLARRPEPLPSYCSTFDRDGGQVLVLGGWDEEHCAWALVGIIHGELGLSTVAWLPNMSRNRLKSVLESLVGKRSEEMVEVPTDFAATRLQWAMQQAEAAGRRIEGDRTRLRRLLQGVAPVAALPFAAPGDQGSGSATPGPLLADPCYSSWLLDLPDLFDATRVANLIPDAPLVELKLVTPEQVWGHATDWLDDARREVLTTRLTLTAMLLTSLKRTAAADVAWAVAEELQRDRVALADIALFREAIARELASRVGFTEVSEA